MKPRPGLEHIAKALRRFAVPIAQLRLDPRNARKHSAKNIKAIARSLKRFGQVSPIKLAKDRKTILAGNGTLQAAKKLGWKYIAAIPTNLTKKEATAYSLADNRTAELAEWDDPTLLSLLKTLDDDAQLAAGFEKTDLEALIDDLEPNFAPASEDEQSPLDDRSPIRCPHCKKVFTHR